MVKFLYFTKICFRVLTQVPTRKPSSKRPTTHALANPMMELDRERVSSTLKKLEQDRVGTGRAGGGSPGVGVVSPPSCEQTQLITSPSRKLDCNNIFERWWFTRWLKNSQEITKSIPLDVS